MFDDIYFDDIYKVIFEIYVEDKLANRQSMQAPADFIIINFVQTAEQIQNDPRPIMLKLSRPVVIWDNFENKEKVLNNTIELSNRAMDAWRSSKQN